MIDKIPGLTDALVSLYPGAIWTLRGDKLDWSDENDLPPPTEEEVQAEIERLQSEYESVEYQRLRTPEYPDLKELADALYWSSKGDNTKLDEYYAKCEEVKLKYPKPEQ